jgi:hypothetical protein
MSTAKGDRVIAKVYGGRYVFARVWATSAASVELTADPYYRALLGGANAPIPIPFPADEVFFDDAIPRAEIEAGREPSQETLRRWRPSSVRGPKGV